MARVQVQGRLENILGPALSSGLGSTLVSIDEPLAPVTDDMRGSWLVTGGCWLLVDVKLRVYCLSIEFVCVCVCVAFPAFGLIVPRGFVH